MKKFIAFALLLSVVCAVSALTEDGSPPAPTGRDVGRYQLAAGAAPMLQIGSQIETIFRIDTVTGQTWKLNPEALVTPTGTAVVHVWQPVEEVGGKLHRAAMTSMQTR